MAKVPSPNRRTLLQSSGTALLAGLAGCLSSAPSSTPTLTSSNTPTSTQAGNCPPERVTPLSYPERPVTLSNESVRTFAADLERAYVYSREGGPDVVDISFDPEPDEVTRVDDGWMVRIETSKSKEVCNDGSLGVGDAHYTARYFINESHIYRADEAFSGPVPDPREEGFLIDTSDGK